jgi:hypothetical protein
LEVIARPGKELLTPRGKRTLPSVLKSLDFPGNLEYKSTVKEKIRSIQMTKELGPRVTGLKQS